MLKRSQINDVRRHALAQYVRPGGMNVNPMSKQVELAEDYDRLEDEVQTQVLKMFPHFNFLNESLKSGPWSERFVLIGGRTVDQWMDLVFYNSLKKVVTTHPPKDEVARTYTQDVDVQFEPPLPFDVDSSRTRVSNLEDLQLQDVLITYHNRSTLDTKHFTFISERPFDNVALYSIHKYGMLTVKAKEIGHVYIWCNLDQDFQSHPMDMLATYSGDFRLKALSTTVTDMTTQMSEEYLNLQIIFPY